LDVISNMSSDDKTVTFLNRMRKSYKVTLSPNIKFLNARGSHVETDMEQLTGQTFKLGQRSESHIRGQTAVMYEVIGVTNNRRPAHLTVYFGAPEGAEEY
jgi:hypothetical protein